jgi:hypothetical protein
MLFVVTVGESDNRWATGPTLFKTSKGQQYKGSNLAQDPILKELLLGLSCRYT